MKKTTLALSVLTAVLTLTSCTEKPNFELSDSSAANPASGDSIIQYDIEDSADVSGGSDSDPADAEAFDYMAHDLSGYIRVGEYRGLTVTQASDVLTDEEFENEINAMLDNYSYYEEITDRAVAEGDSVLADYSGYKDGEAFAGGTAYNQQIIAASGTGYIEGFAEAFIGQTPGQEFEFNVTFPEDYGAEELAGQEVTFKCTVHSIMGENLITPELTDEFVQEKFGYNNVEEFRISFRGTVEEQKSYYVRSNMRSDLWKQVVDAAEVLAYPEEEVERIYGQQRAMYEDYASYYQTDYETFLVSYMNTTDDALMDDARSYVKEDLVMYQLVRDLGVELSDEEFEQLLPEFAGHSGATVEDLVSYYGEDTLRLSVLWEKLMDVIAGEANIIVE